jgi:uncharacterized protein DUF5961
MNQPGQRHRFSAHVRDQIHARHWVAEADSFIDAAIRFAETADVGEEQVSIVVTECDSGKHRCFLVNLGTGEVQSC